MSLWGIIINLHAYKQFRVGSENQAIKEDVDMNENRQPMGECRRRQEAMNLLLSPQGADWSTSLGPKTTTQLSPNYNAWFNWTGTSIKDFHFL